VEIGLIVSDRSFISELQDLTYAIKKAGCRPISIEIDNIAVKIKNGRLSPYQMFGSSREEQIDPECAVLRHIGFIKDYEQFSQRIWSVKALEMKGTYVANNIKSWLKASDKLGALMELSRRGLPVPDTISSENPFAGYNAVKEFKSSVIKPLRSGAGFGVFKADDPDVAMHIFSYFINLSKPIYVQKFLNKKGNGDYRIIVVGGQVIGAEFRTGTDWKSNVSQGAKAKAAKPDEELKEIAIKAAQAMELDYVGVDIADTEDGYYILETNPTIAWGTFKKVTKVNPAKHIIAHIIKKARS
jgi:ribosomal protein S6--L-glutamate ligase